MPKIIIREIDKTTAGQAEYSNFSVVVPGFCGTPKEGYDPNEVFDKNGVYECSSQKDFINYVGTKKGEMDGKKAAENAKPNNFGTKEAPVYHKQLTANEFYKTYANIVYKVKEPVASTVDGYLIWVDTEDGNKKYRLEPADIWQETESYFVIEKGNEGHDPVKYEYNGNQIAYELLGLGYTVLFKKIDETTGITALDDPDFWNCLRDKSIYDFRYICTGGYATVDAYKEICAIAAHNKAETLDKPVEENGRGDCVALIDVNEDGFTQKDIVSKVKAYVKELQGNINQYAAIFCPKVTYAGKKEEVKYYGNLQFPASFHYLVCAAYARNDLNFAEWYAVAGYTRGVSNKTIASTTFKFGEIEINALQPRTSDTDDFRHAVNVITNIHGAHYIWGNRTAYKLDTKGLVASHFLNIRQLCSTLKKQLYITCRQLTFDPNSDVLWSTFCNAIKPTLEKMKADQGIQDYKIIKVRSDRKALLTAKVRIVPIEAVEDFDISIYLEDSVSGITVASNEE